MADLFVSYSRKDAEFVRRLCDALSNARREAWADWRDIPPTAEWLEEIRSGIENSDNFLFVISPDSVESTVCQSELSQAVELKKRLIPLLHRDVPDSRLPAPLGKINFISFRDSDDFQSAFAILRNALDEDLDLKRRHTRLLVRAREWETRENHPSLLLRGKDLRDAQEWQAKSSSTELRPTHLHSQFILASNRDQTRRQRLTIGAITGALLLTVLLSIFAWNQRNSARRQATLATARYLASQSEEARAGSAETSALLAVESARLLPLLESNTALEKTLPLLRKRIRTIAPGKPVYDVSFSSDSRQIATGSDDGAHIYEVSDGKEVHAFPQASMVGLVALSPDGRYLATATKSQNNQPDLDRARVFDVASGKMLKEVQKVKVTGVVFSPNGEYFAVAGFDFAVPVLETSDWRTATTLRLRDSTQSIAFSPDSLYIATGNVFSGAHIFDTKSGNERSFVPHPATVSSLAFSRDEHYLVTGSWDKQARIFDLRNGKTVASIAREEMVNRVDFSPDGRFVAVSDLKNAVAIFATSGGEEAGKLEYEGGVRFSPDGQMLATTNSDGARLYSSIESVPKARVEYDSNVNSIAVSRDQMCIATTSVDALRITDWQGHLVAQSSLPQTTYGEIALSTDCAYVAAAVRESKTGNQQEAVLIFDVQRRAQVARLPHSDIVQTVIFHPNGKLLVTGEAEGDSEGKVHVFDIAGGKLIRDLPLKGDVSLSFSSDGRYLVATTPIPEGSDIQVLDFSSGKIIWQSRQNFQVLSVAMSPDDTYLAAGAGDANLRIYNVRSGRLAAQIQSALGLLSVAFSADGQHVAAGSVDKTASVFEFPGGRKVAQTDCLGEIRLIQFSAEDKYLVCAAVDATNADIAIAKRMPWRTKDLEEAVCALVTRNLYDWEWRQYLEGKPRKTCEKAP